MQYGIKPHLLTLLILRYLFICPRFGKKNPIKKQVGEVFQGYNFPHDDINDSVQNCHLASENPELFPGTVCQKQKSALFSEVIHRGNMVAVNFLEIVKYIFVKGGMVIVFSIGSKAKCIRPMRCEGNYPFIVL